MISLKTMAELEALIQKDPVVIIDWTASWCGPCKAIAPKFKKMAETFQDVATFVKIDIDEFDNVPDEIQAVPTFHGVANGKLVMSECGGMKEAELRKFIEDTIAKKV